MFRTLSWRQILRFIAGLFWLIAFAAGAALFVSDSELPKTQVSPFALRQPESSPLAQPYTFVSPLTLDFPAYRNSFRQTGLSFESLTILAPLLAGFFAWAASLKSSTGPIGRYAPTSDERRRNRLGMIDRVRQRWIDDEFHRSLHGAVLLRLGMGSEPGAIDYPWDILAQVANQPDRLLPPRTRICEVYDKTHQTLLILGDPGSGKSTMLLDLTRELLERAAMPDSITPIPAVFTLTTWNAYQAVDTKSLDSWLVREMQRLYGVPANIGQYLLDHNELALLLDGLDEVAADRRMECVRAINQFYSEHMSPIIVSSRSNEYEELIEKLKLHGAVRLLPLKPKDVARYVASLPSSTSEKLTNTFNLDSSLLDLASSPLMLSVMTLAVNELDELTVARGMTAEVLRVELFYAYLVAMLKRERASGIHGRVVNPDDDSYHQLHPYGSAHTVNWLQWLANQMNFKGQSVFLLERMNRSWCNRSLQKWLWSLGVGVIIGIVVGGVVGLALGLLIGLRETLLAGLAAGAILGIVSGLLATIAIGLDDIEVEERTLIQWNFGRLFFGLLGGYFGGIIMSSVFGPALGLAIGLDMGLVLGLVAQSSNLESTFHSSKPNQAITASLRHGVFIWLSTWLLGSLVFAFVNWYDRSMSVGPVTSLVSLLVLLPTIGFVFGIFYGLDSVIKHYFLRLILWRDGSMPFFYVQFLDYCVEKVLLRRVGGGYMFIHRTFQDYMATVDIDRVLEKLNKSGK